MFVLQQFTIVLNLVLAVSVLKGNCSEAGNWFTKSLDYYSLEKCSYLDKSNMVGDLQACLNSPVDPSATTTKATPITGGFDAGNSGFGGWGSKSGQSTSEGNQGKGGFDFTGGFSGQSGFNNFGTGSKTSQTKTSTSSDSWPNSLIEELSKTVSCFPKLIKPCMTPTETDFYLTIRNFFQSQIDYATPNASLIAQKIDESGCVKSNTIDTNTICYSTNLHKQNWFGWKINWIDGQMCRFIDDISTCEASSFDKCPPEVISFVDGLWNAGLQATPCLNQTTNLTTNTAPSPPPTTTPKTESVLPASDKINQSSPSLTHPVASSKLRTSKSPPKLVSLTHTNSIGEQKSKIDSTSLVFSNDENVKGQNSRSKYSGFSKNKQPKYRTNPDFDEFRMQRARFNNFPNSFGNDGHRDDFRGDLSKKVRLHEVDGEGESRHDRDNRRKGVAEEQWLRIKEEFRRRMIESMESRESDESEYESESEQSDEDKNIEIFEGQVIHQVDKPRFNRNPQRYGHNQEDDYRDSNRRKVNSLRRRDDYEDERQQRQQEDRRRRREEAERRREEEEEEERRREESEERRWEEEEEKRRRSEEEEERAREEDEERRQLLIEEEERRREEEEQQRERRNEMRFRTHGRRGKRSIKSKDQTEKKHEQELEKKKKQQQEEEEKRKELEEDEKERKEDQAEKAREEEAERREAQEEQEKQRLEDEEEQREAEEEQERQRLEDEREMQEDEDEERREKLEEEQEEKREKEEERKEKKKEKKRKMVEKRSIPSKDRAEKKREEKAEEAERVREEEQNRKELQQKEEEQKREKDEEDEEKRQDNEEKLREAEEERKEKKQAKAERDEKLVRPLRYTRSTGFNQWRDYAHLPLNDNNESQF